MSQLGLCRFVRSASGLSRLISKNHRLLSTCNNDLVLAKLKPISLGSSNLPGSKVSSRIIHQYSRKVVPELSTPMVLQCRSMSGSGDHVRLWQIERIIAATFIILFPGCFIVSNPVIDGLYALLVVMHAHWGFEAVIVDYVRPSVVGPILPKISYMALYFVSALTFVGLLHIIYNGRGLGNTIKSFWSIGSKPAA